MSFFRHTARMLSLSLALGVPAALVAQAAPKASGTVKSVTGQTVVLGTDAGAQVTVTVAPDAKILVIPPGSKDLKSATPAALENIAVGDRALVNGRAGDTDTALNAVRVVVIKSTAISARNAGEQADWQRRGTGGIVKSVDGSAMTVAAGARTLTISTSPSTVFKRYAEDSVKFEDAKSGSLAEIKQGDQLRARGDKSEDGLTIKADEVVTGTFANLSGVLVSVDAANGTLTLKDLATKKNYVVKVTANADLRRLPPEAAASLAARGRAGSPSASGAPGGAGSTQPGARPYGSAAGAGAPGNNAVMATGHAAGQSAAGQGSAGPGSAGPGSTGPGSTGPGPTGPGSAGSGGARRGGDLSQLLARFPVETLTDLKPGVAVLIVASQSQTPGQVTAITLLSGVDALLTAPPGSEPFTLSPWNIGAPDASAGGGGGR